MGFPNVFLCAAYFTAISKAACAIPSACAAMPTLPLSNCLMANLKPSPTSPNTFSLGMRTFSNVKLQVGDALIPSLSCNFPGVNPGYGNGTMKAVIPINKFSYINNI